VNENVTEARERVKRARPNRLRMKSRKGQDVTIPLNFQPSLAAHFRAFNERRPLERAS
jgi:hypothetical protein